MTEEENKKTKIDWESKIWYRMSKVVYFAFLIFALLFVSLLAYLKIPSTNTYNDSEKTIVKCSNGKTYNANDNSLYLYDNDNLELYDKQLKSLCTSGNSDILTTLRTEKNSKLPYEKNYRVQFFETTSQNGSWEEVFVTLIIGIPIVFIVFEITKRIFLYISIGKHVFNNKKIHE